VAALLLAAGPVLAQDDPRSPAVLLPPETTSAGGGRGEATGSPYLPIGTAFPSATPEGGPAKVETLPLPRDVSGALGQTLPLPPLTTSSPGLPAPSPGTTAPEDGVPAPGPAGPHPALPLPVLRAYHWQDCFLGFPEEFHEPPLGHSVYAAYKTQVANGAAARMVLYRYDFVDGCGLLNPRGKERLAEIAALLPHTFFPVVIEGCAPGLDESRRLAVLEELGRCPFPIPPQRVVVGRPIAVGLSGTEALLVYQNLLFQTRRQGAPGGFGGGLIGGTVGQGFGATGGTATGTGAGVGAGAGVGGGVGP
jgi:hypothetical protein